MIINVLIIAGIIVLIPFFMALFINKEYTVERNIIINKPKQEVFDYVKFLKNQDHYNKWVMTDPDMKKAYKGTDGTRGFIYIWDGNKKAGKGEQEITHVTEGERIETEIRFIRPFESTGYTHMVTESVSDNQTQVFWGMKGKSKYPMNFMNLFMNNMLGKDMETSLSTLKGILEK